MAPEAMADVAPRRPNGVTPGQETTHVAMATRATANAPVKRWALTHTHTEPPPRVCVCVCVCRAVTRTTATLERVWTCDWAPKGLLTQHHFWPGSWTLAAQPQRGPGRLGSRRCWWQWQRRLLAFSIGLAAAFAFSVEPLPTEPELLCWSMASWTLPAVRPRCHFAPFSSRRLPDVREIRSAHGC